MTERISPQTELLQDQSAEKFLPFTPDSAAKFKEVYGDSKDLLKSGLQSLVDAAANKWGVISFDGLPASGKTTMQAQLGNILRGTNRNIILTKFSGYIDNFEAGLFNLENLGRSDPAIAVFLEKLKELQPNAEQGELSWQLLQQLNTYYLTSKRQTDRVNTMIGVRGPINRILSWEKRPETKLFDNPFGTNFFHPFLNDSSIEETSQFGSNENAVTMPLPNVTIILTCSKDKLLRRANNDSNKPEEANHRVNSIKRNFQRFTELTHEYTQKYPESFFPIEVSQSPEAVFNQVVAIMVKKGLI